MNNNTVASIIILYNPNWTLLREVINEASLQSDKVFAVDNSERDNKAIFLEIFSDLQNVIYYPLNANKGIAKAQNIGLLLARKEQFSYVIFFDQDSVAVPKLVGTLIHDFEHLRLNDINVGTIGPLPINSATNEFYEPRVLKNRSLLVNEKDFIKTKQIISSGGLMKVDDFEIIGDFDELLFIDGVDHEWCWRAKMKGYEVFLSPRARLIHSLGEGDKKLFGFNVATTSSFRLYYQYRNYIVLLFRGYVPLYWKFNNLIKYIVKMLYYPILRKDIKVLWRIFKGVRDGLKLILKRDAK